MYFKNSNTIKCYYSLKKNKKYQPIVEKITQSY